MSEPARVLRRPRSSTPTRADPVEDLGRELEARRPYVLALAKMVWGTEDAIELSSLIAPASLPDKISRDLFVFLAREKPKGASVSTLESAIVAQLPHALPLFNELLAEAGTDAMFDEASNSYLAERVNDEGKRARLERSAGQILASLREGAPTEQILRQADMQRAAIDLAGDRSDTRFLLRDDEQLEDVGDAEWLIDGVLPQDAVVALVGPSGTFKSFLATDWCFHIRTGLTWHGRHTSVGDVVYLCAEGIPGLRRRIAAWKKFHEVSGRLGVHFLTNGLMLNDPVETANILKAIQLKALAPRLIVVDTLHRFLSGNENSAEDMGAFIRGCDELRRKFRASVVIIHHTGKDPEKGARGSSSLNAAVDTEIMVSREDGAMDIELFCTKQKDAPDRWKLALEAVSVGGSLVLKPSGVGGAPLAGKTLDALLALHENDAGFGMLAGEWEKASGQGNSTFYKSRNSLKDNGYVTVAKGRYSVTDAGRLSLHSTDSTRAPL